RWLALLCLMAVSAASAGLVLAQSTTEPTATEQSVEPVMAAPVTAAELPGERFGVREMFTQADLAVKSVMILLVLMSLLTWAVLLEKSETFAGARGVNRRFLAVLRAGVKAAMEQQASQSDLGRMWRAGQSELRHFMQHRGSN